MFNSILDFFLPAVRCGFFFVSFHRGDTDYIRLTRVYGRDYLSCYIRTTGQRNRRGAGLLGGLDLGWPCDPGRGNKVRGCFGFRIRFAYFFLECVDFLTARRLLTRAETWISSGWDARLRGFFCWRCWGGPPQGLGWAGLAIASVTCWRGGRAHAQRIHHRFKFPAISGRFGFRGPRRCGEMAPRPREALRWVVLVRAVDGGGPVSGLVCWIWIRGFIPLVGWLSVGPGQARCRLLLSCRLALACFAGALESFFPAHRPQPAGLIGPCVSACTACMKIAGREGRRLIPRADSGVPCHQIAIKSRALALCCMRGCCLR